MKVDGVLQLAESSSQIVVANEWSQGRSVYGGISSALLYQSMKPKVDELRVLRSLSVNFVGPLFTEQPFDIVTTVLREGRNMSQVMAQAIQDGQVKCMAVGCFGEHRRSKMVVDSLPAESPLAPPRKNNFPRLPMVTPKYAHQIDFDIQQGKLPFTASKQHQHAGWFRFRHENQQFTDAHLVALADAWPPTVLQMSLGPSPASSVSWNLEFLHPHPEFCANPWLSYHAWTRQSGDGYAHEEADIRDEAGRLIAVSRQLVAVFG